MAVLRLRAARAGDSRRLWLWRNDPAVRRRSFHSEKVAWKEHQRWLGSKLRDPQVKILIVSLGKTRPAGQVRLERSGRGTAEIHLALAAHARGKGLGAPALAAACRYAARRFGVRRLKAHILAGNRRSEKIFKLNGFKKVRTLAIRGRKASLWMLTGHHA